MHNELLWMFWPSNVLTNVWIIQCYALSASANRSNSFWLFRFVNVKVVMVHQAKNINIFWRIIGCEGNCVKGKCRYYRKYVCVQNEITVDWQSSITSTALLQHPIDYNEFVKSVFTFSTSASNLILILNLSPQNDRS